MSYGYIKDYTGCYIMNRKIVTVETKTYETYEFNLLLLKNFTLELKQYFDTDLQVDRSMILFSELIERLDKANIELDDIKSISYEKWI